MSKSIFSSCKLATPLAKKYCKGGILTLEYDKDIKNLRVGPKLNALSPKIEVAEKMRQIHAIFYMRQLYPNIENIPTFPDYEKEIKRYPFPSFIYSYYFLKKPWPEAERIISQDKTASILYSIHVLKRRFELGEDAMKNDPEICLAYCIKIFKRKRLPNKMHQAMLLNSLKESNRSIERYLNYKNVK